MRARAVGVLALLALLAGLVPCQGALDNDDTVRASDNSATVVTASSSLLADLLNFEVVELASTTHALQGPPIQQAQEQARAERTLAVDSTTTATSELASGDNGSSTGAAEPITNGTHPHAFSTETPPMVHPRVHTLAFTSHGATFSLALEKSRGLFAPTYSETRAHWTVNGVRHAHLEPAARALEQVEHCYYQGLLHDIATGETNPALGRAGLDTCEHGFSGMIRLAGGNRHPTHPDGETFVIAPAHKHLDAARLQMHVQSIKAQRRQRMHTQQYTSNYGTDDEVNPHALHIVYRLRDLRTFSTTDENGAPASLCGVGDTRHENATHYNTLAAKRLLGKHQRGKQVYRARDVAYDAEDHYGMFAPDLGFAALVGGPKAAGLKPAEEAASAEDDTNEELIPVFGTSRADAIPSQRYIELFVANDHLRYQALGQNTETVTARVVNLINTLYIGTQFAPASLQVTLVGQMTFFNQDPWNITLGACSAAGPNEICVDTLLSTWNVWRRNPTNTAPYQNNDAGHLFSAQDFQASVLGYAGVGAMCSTAQSGGINQLTSASDTFNSVIAAHEIGHNLGMQHDSSQNSCPSSGFVMNAVVSSVTVPTAFSSCSLNYYTTWTNSGAGTCLNNVPTQRWGDAVCGNGYVEAGEQCDCGPYGAGTDIFNVSPDFCLGTSNPCCDPMSCQLISGAECSETDACCDSCKVTSKAAKKVCRDQASACDLPETCDGVSSQCPVDDALGNGAKCLDTTYGAGACFEGKCQSYARQCREVGALFTGGPYIPCPVQTSLNRQKGSAYGYCNYLYCATSSSSSSCYNFTVSADAETMADGNPCGETQTDGTVGTNYLCNKNQCVAAESTNERFQWRSTEWNKCADCNTIQYRNVTCVRVATGEAVDSPYCTTSGKPPISQPCSDEELLCSESLGGTITLRVLGHEVVISSYVVGGASAGVFVFLMVMLWLCANCVKKRELDKLKVQRDQKRAAKALNEKRRASIIAAQQDIQRRASLAAAGEGGAGLAGPSSPQSGMVSPNGVHVQIASPSHQPQHRASLALAIDSPQAQQVYAAATVGAGTTPIASPSYLSPPGGQQLQPPSPMTPAEPRFHPTPSMTPQPAPAEMALRPTPTLQLPPNAHGRAQPQAQGAVSRRGSAMQPAAHRGSAMQPVARRASAMQPATRPAAPSLTVQPGQLAPLALPPGV